MKNLITSFSVLKFKSKSKKKKQVDTQRENLTLIHRRRDLDSL